MCVLELINLQRHWYNGTTEKNQRFRYLLDQVYLSIMSWIRISGINTYIYVNLYIFKVYIVIIINTCLWMKGIIIFK